MNRILITLILIFSISIASAQDQRVVRLDDSRENVISSEIIINEFEEDRAAPSIDLYDVDLITDTDADGMSDYIERELYFTDFNNRSTVGDSRGDLTKILLGYDPLSETPREVKYEDIRDDSDANVSEYLKITGVNLINSRLSLIGTGLPNSLTTIFIYDVNLVVFVRTDENGKWFYQLSKELSDDVYSMYLGVLNSEGTVVLKSDELIFQQDLGNVIINPEFEIGDLDPFELFLEYFWWIMLGIFIFGLLVVSVLIWRNTEINRGD